MSSITKGSKIGMLFCLVFILLVGVRGLPSPAVEFYGNITLRSIDEIDGDFVEAFDSDGVLCGNFDVVNEGYFGLLSCNGDDPNSPEDEGAVANETITFKLNNVSTRASGNRTWLSAGFLRVDLRTNYAPIIYGIRSQTWTAGVLVELQISAVDPDGDTLSYYDNSSIFEIGRNTGFINFTPILDQTGRYYVNISASDGLLSSQITVDITIINGSCGDTRCSIYETCITCPEDCGECVQPSAGVTAAAESGGAAESQRSELQQIEKEECIENWNCTEWSECYENGTQTRSCTDLNNCGTNNDKPATERECEHGSCFDNIQNCHDGVCEEGIDCGGPCAPCRIFGEEEAYAEPFEEIPKAVCGNGVCELGENCQCPKDCRDASLFPWWLFLLIILGVTILMIIANSITYYLENKQGEHARYEEFRERSYQTWIAAVVFIFIIAVYCYWLWWCWPYIVSALIITVVLITLLLLLISGVYTYKTRYDESKKREKLAKLMQMHIRQLKELIEIQGKLVQKIENRYVRKVYELYKAGDELLRKVPEVTKIYNTIRELQKKREKQEPIFENEKIIVAEVSTLEEKESFISMLNENAVLQELDDELKHIISYLVKKHSLIEKVQRIRRVLKGVEPKPLKPKE